MAPDFRTQLLNIVQHGRLSLCIDAVLAVIGSPDEQTRLRYDAVSAVEAFEDPFLNVRLFKIVDNLPTLPNLLCASIIKILYPKNISSAELFRLLAKTEPVREFGADLPYVLNTHLQAILTYEEAGTCLSMLIALAQTPPLQSWNDKVLRISESFWWVGKIIPTVAGILLRKTKLSEHDAEVAAEALQLLTDFRKNWDHDEDGHTDLDLATHPHAELRRRYVWLMVKDFRAELGNEPEMSFQLLGYYEVLKLAPSDFSWLIEDIRSSPDQKDKLLAARLALEAWDLGGRKIKQRWILQRATRDAPDLRDALSLSALSKIFLPLRRLVWKRFNQQLSRWWWRQKWNNLVNSLRWPRSQFFLLRKLRVISSGKNGCWLHLLLHECGNMRQWTVTSWENLEKRRGKRIAQAAKRGCMAFWRSYQPALPHEKPKPNESNGCVAVGLTGLYAEFHDNERGLSKLTPTEAKIATRYALDELNDFPTWFRPLATTHPAAVMEVLVECTDAAWRTPSGLKETNKFLADLAWHGEGINHLVRGKLLELLEAGEPQNHSVLLFTLSILMRQHNPPLQRLAEVAVQRVDIAMDMVPLIIWLKILMFVDGSAAMNCLHAVLKRFPNPHEIIVGLCSSLSGGESHSGLSVENPSYLSARNLRLLIPIVYQYVDYSSDIERPSGEVYSPTDRDHAQTFRNVILDYLAKSEEPEATLFLRELADEPLLLRVREWILDHLERRLEKESDLEPWKPADIREFAGKHEVDPKNDGELFAIALKRLTGIKLDVEKSDNSLRDELRKNDNEIVLRRWLQRKLNERSRNRYTVPQEEEIDQRQRPDLRIEHPHIYPVSIEVKWADDWTLPVLLERLENQLVGQYLRAHYSGYGIYILGYIENKKHWEDPVTGTKLSFEAVTQIIKAAAVALQRANPKIIGLEVISIDFSQP